MNDIVRTPSRLDSAGIMPDTMPWAGVAEGGLRWYAVYTRFWHERNVEPDLDRLKLDHYVPVMTKERRYKDRRKKIEVPLFKSYVFVQCDLG